mmetsp:Transcript_10245/g.12432  ORF Transcript_10245/g.12432 Transcript_10245/m.12432 type:complete len:431 (+) Transcript_10245:79-1371(+)
MEPPPQYPSTYGALHWCNFHVERAVIPDVSVPAIVIKSLDITVDEKWSEYSFSNEEKVIERWENYERIKKMEEKTRARVLAEAEQKAKDEAAKRALAQERAKKEAEAEQLIKSRAAAAEAEKAKAEAEAEALIKTRAETAAKLKILQKEKEKEEAKLAALKEVSSVTHLSQAVAEKLLLDHDGDVQKSIQAFFDGSLSPTSSPPTSIAPLTNNSSSKPLPLSYTTPVDPRLAQNMERENKQREEDRLLQNDLLGLSSTDWETQPASRGSEFGGGDRSIEQLMREYGGDETRVPPMQAALPRAQQAPAQAVLQPFTTSNPFVDADPFSSATPSPKTPLQTPASPAIAASPREVPEGLPPPVYPQPPAYPATTALGSGSRSQSVGVDFPPEHNDKVQQLISLTQASKQECELLLFCENFDLDRACNSYFNSL